jgi:hypothetical protein
MYGFKMYYLANPNNDYVCNCDLSFSIVREIDVEATETGNLILKLTEPYHFTDKVVVTDYYFTTFTLAASLLKKVFTLLEQFH